MARPTRRHKRSAKLSDVHALRQRAAGNATSKAGDLTIPVSPSDEPAAPEAAKRPAQPPSPLVRPALYPPDPASHQPIRRRPDIFTFDNLKSEDGEIAHPEIIILASGEPPLSQVYSSEEGDDACGRSDCKPSHPVAVNQYQPIPAERRVIESIEPVGATTPADLPRPKTEIRLTGGGDVELYIPEPQARRRTTTSQIIVLVMGVLLIFSGIALVTTPVWDRSRSMADFLEVGSAILNDQPASSTSLQPGWFGLALVVIGAILEVIGIRPITRR